MGNKLQLDNVQMMNIDDWDLDPYPNLKLNDRYNINISYPPIICLQDYLKNCSNINDVKLTKAYKNIC